MAASWWPFDFGAGEMNVSDAMGIVITGLVVVFLVLILLVIIFSLMGKLFVIKKNDDKKKEEVKASPAPVSIDTRPAPKNDHSLIAAITAALHEYLGGGNFVIKKIRPAKVGSKKSNAWSRSGREENTRPF